LNISVFGRSELVNVQRSGIAKAAPTRTPRSEEIHGRRLLLVVATF
jgi:hypothetical protein